MAMKIELNNIKFGKAMSKEKEIQTIASNLLQTVCSIVGCDLPDNKDEIISFIVEDVMETADPENWHSGDVAIAFRRWMEKDYEC